MLRMRSNIKRIGAVVVMLMVFFAVTANAFRTADQMVMDYNKNGLQAERQSAATNSSVSAFQFTHTTSGTPSAGIGQYLLFRQETSAAGNIENSGKIDVAMTDVTGTSEDSDIVFSSLRAGALTEQFRILSTGAITWTGATTSTTWNLTADSDQVVLDSDGTFTTTITDSAAGSSKVITLPNTTGTLYISGGTDVAVADGGTGVSSWTNGQLLIGNTAGNTAALGTLTGTSNRITVTNGASSITLSTPQDIATTSKVQFAQVNATDLVFADEFLVVDAPQWTTRTTTGSVAVQNAVNGVERLTTGGAGTNEESLDFNDLCPLVNTQQPIVEFRVKLEQITNIEADIGLYESAGVGTDDFIAIKFDASGANTWSLVASKGGVAASDTGAVADTDFHIFKIVWNGDTSLEWFIDGVSQGTLTDAANIPTVQLQPVIAVRTEEAAAHYLDVDYLKVWQDRS